MNSFRLNLCGLIFGCLLPSISCVAQAPVNVPTPGASLPALTLPSANATALGVYGQYPVSYTNGTPDISIPLYTIQTPRLSLPISISCHANGIKVNEFATSVGLGWTLNAGGAITRQVNDVQDFDPNGYAFKPIVPGVHPSPPLGSSPATLDSMTDEQRYYYGRVSGAFLPKGPQKYDGQPDDYMYNFAGKSGRFILKNRLDSAMTASFTTIPYSPLLIQSDPFASVFTIRDEQGTAYIFSAQETSSTGGSSSFSYYPLGGGGVQPGTSGYDPFTTVTAYYLTSMISADLTDTILFKYGSQYNTANLLHYTGHGSSFYYQQQPLGAPGTPSIASSTSTTNTTTNNINLSEIDFKNGKLVFEYASRTDRGAYRLNKIHIYSGSGATFTELKRLDFYQSYFTSNSGSPSQLNIEGTESTLQYRLRLDSLQEEGINSDGTSAFNPPYKFTYYGIIGQPSTISYPGEYGQDLWGYWNGVTTNTNLIIHDGTTTVQPNRVPNPTYLIAGTINTIKYPTRGFTEFQFEPNQTHRAYTTTDTTYNSYHLSTVGTYGSSSTSQTFTAKSAFSASLQFSATSGGCTSNCNLNAAEVDVYDVTGGAHNFVNNIIYSGGLPISGGTYNQTKTISFASNHSYTISFPTPSNYNASKGLQYSLHADMNNAGIDTVILQQHNDLVYTGGLRVTKIINHDKNGTTLTTKRYNYLNPYYISGIFTGDFTSVGKGYNWLSYRFQAGTSWWTGYTVQGLQPWIMAFSENFTVSLGGATDASQAYQEVEEYQQDSLGNSIGKTVYDYNQRQDDTTDVFSTIRINNAWRRNQLLETRSYKSSGGNFILVNDVRNTYQDLFPALQDTTFAITVHRLYTPGDGGAESESTQTYAVGPAYETDINGSNVFNANVYHVAVIPEVAFRNALTSTLTTTYDLNGANPVTSTTNYFYGNPQHMMATKIETLKSNQDSLIHRVSYPTDYAINTCNQGQYLTTLKANLASIRATYIAQSYPVFTQWYAYMTRYAAIYGNCFYLNSGAPNSQSGICWSNNHLTQYNSQIESLYAQYGTMKAAYQANVRSAVASYNSSLSSYQTCYNSLFSSAADSIKALLLMQQSNQLEPVEVDATLRNHSSGVENMISATKASYKTTSSTTSQIGKTLLGSFVAGVTYSTYTGHPNQYLYVDQNYDGYNAAGNLTDYHDKLGSPQAFIWGYNQQYPIAKVTNATATQIAYTGFEDGSSTSGNWHYTAGGLTTAPIATMRSGKYAYKLASGSVTTSIPAGKYIVSYWANAALTVNSTAPTTTGDADTHGWTYYEHIVTMATSGTLTVSGTGTAELDELRLYPIGSQMASYTYTPLVGITSMENKDGHNTFYDYDAFQRLLDTRDDQKHILQEYKYNYSSH